MSRARISNYRRGVAAIALSAVLAGGFVATGPLGALNDARAEAVQITPPLQAVGFADLVEKVRPAVVSVRVKKDIQETADRGGRGQFFGPPGFDQLPDDHP